MSRQGHVFIDESNHALGRAEGYDACLAVWAMTDADTAVSALTSAANRITAARDALTPADRDRIDNIAARTRLVLDLMMSLVGDTT